MENLNYARNTKTVSFIIGLVLLAIGLFELLKVQGLQKELLTRQLGEKDKYYTFCQSCGKNFSSIHQHGRNSDGTINKAFCFDCYDNDLFKEPNITAEDIKRRMIADLKSEKTTLFKSQLLNRLKSLERWQKSKYY